MNVINQIKYAYIQELSEAIHFNKPTKIKFSPNLFLLLVDRFEVDHEKYFMLTMVEKATWQGIPVEIDRDKESYTYELVYEENNK